MNQSSSGTDAVRSMAAPVFAEEASAALLTFLKQATANLNMKFEGRNPNATDFESRHVNTVPEFFTSSMRVEEAMKNSLREDVFATVLMDSFGCWNRWDAIPRNFG